SFGDSIKKQSFKTGAPNILPVAQAKEVINELKAGTARVQALLKSFATSTNSERQGIIEQVVIEANKQTHQVDELFKKNQLPKGLGRQASGFRNYFEAIRQELVPEMIANNVSAVQKLYRQSGYRSEGLASFEDIKNEISRLINEIKQSVGAVDPEAQFYEASARIYKNLNRFNKAENVINQRYTATTGDTDPEVQFYEASAKIDEILNEIYENLNRFNKAENVINQRYTAATGDTGDTVPEVQFDEASVSAKIEEILNEIYENANRYAAATVSQLDSRLDVFGGKDNAFTRFIRFVKSELNGNDGFLGLVKKSAGVVAGFIASFIGLQTIQAFSGQLKQFADRSIEVASNLEVIKS
ncbi:MAG: hypothetical protein ACKPEQ_36795, partial [Dolichospermum sp.]